MSRKPVWNNSFRGVSTSVCGSEDAYCSGRRLATARRLPPQRIVLAAPGPKTVREPEEVFLIDLVQYGGGCSLDDLVLKRRHGERSLPSVSFLDSLGISLAELEAAGADPPIAAGRPTSRAFDNWFENSDGDEVATIVYRRSIRHPKIAANIWRYLDRKTVTEAAARLSHVPTRDMPRVAAESRAQAARR
jgi:hypothetical protein